MMLILLAVIENKIFHSSYLFRFTFFYEGDLDKKSYVSAFNIEFLVEMVWIEYER